MRRLLLRVFAEGWLSGDHIERIFTLQLDAKTQLDFQNGVRVLEAPRELVQYKQEPIVSKP